jgi:hypothetical protein
MSEQLEGIFEHDRQLDELSNLKTYGNYIKKSARKLSQGLKHGLRTGTNIGSAANNGLVRLVNLGKKGIGRATDALVGGKKKAKKPVMEAGEAELGRARKAETQARKGAVERSGTTVDGKVVKAGQRVQKLRLKKLTKERIKTGLNPRIDDTRANRSHPYQATGSMGPITKGYKRDVPKKVLDYRAASNAKKQAALRSKGLA